MASNQKEVKVTVATEEELAGVEALELRINKLKKQKIQIGIDIASQKLEDTQAKIEQLKQEKANLEVGVDDSKIKQIDAEIAQLDQESLDLQLTIETGELQKAKAEVEELDNEEIEIQLRNQSAMESIDQISQGFDRLKQGAGEVAEQMGAVLESAGKQETNKTFLENALGDTDKAKQKMDEINQIVTDLPGDDTALQGLLSSAAAKDASLTSDALESMANNATDYFSAMSFYGKSASEAQQDMTNYLLTGNTAELERSPILQAHVDKLKEASTVEERNAALAEALTQEHWAGMGAADTYNNKLETFNGMLERGKYNLGGMFQEGAKGGMDFLINLDQATGGLVGMGIALGGFASPITDTIMGLGQMAMGINALKDLGLVKYLKESAAAQWLLNAAESANPIGILIIAIAALVAILAYLYFNNEQVRAAIDGLGQTFMWVGQIMYTSIINAINWIIGALQNLWNYIFTLGGLIPANVSITGNQIIDTILRVLAFLLTLPIQVAKVFINIIAKALGFGDNFSQRMISGAVNAVNGFISWISTLPGRLAEELNKMLQMAADFAMEIANKLTGGAAGMVVGWVTGSGERSPGFMYDAFEGELQSMDDTAKVHSSRLQSVIGNMGAGIVDSFGEPSLGLRYEDTMNSRLETATMNNDNGNTYNFYHYGDMDNEERQEKFVDAVIRRLYFENKTAGRKV